MQTFTNVTMYRTSEFFGNVIAVECRTLSIEIKPYAQHAQGFYVRYIPKGARKERGFVLGYRPRLWVVAGFNQVKPDGLFDKGVVLSSGDGVTVTKASYSAFDDRFESDFVAKLNGARVVFSAAEAA